MTPLVLTHYTATSCLGPGLAPLVCALRNQRGGLEPCHFHFFTPFCLATAKRIFPIVAPQRPALYFSYFLITQ